MCDFWVCGAGGAIFGAGKSRKAKPNGIIKRLISGWKKQKIISRNAFPAGNGKREIKIGHFRAETACGKVFWGRCVEILLFYATTTSFVLYSKLFSYI